MHLFTYAILYVLFYRAMNWERGNKQKNALLPMIFTVAYAVSDELHQTFVPGRTSAFYDIGYDTLGATIAMLKMRRYI